MDPGRKKFLGGGTVFGQDSVRTVLNIALAEFLGTGFLVFLGCMSNVVGLGEFPPTHLQISITFGMVVATAIQCCSILEMGEVTFECGQYPSSCPFPSTALPIRLCLHVQFCTPLVKVEPLKRLRALFLVIRS
uniref:Aquaporin n=1 Tax=Timema cristinae TaxID=61476 RepID=A0A7R9CCZ7_TIMCR|nr:unnamed protein product [Timema cristinae]